MFNDAKGTEFKKIYILCGYTDMRQGINGLSDMVMYQYHLNVFDKGTLFLFCGKRRSTCKALLWEGDGFVLLTKRLGNGHFQWPGRPEEMKNLTSDEFRNLMKGFTIDSSIKEMNPGSYDSFDF